MNCFRPFGVNGRLPVSGVRRCTTTVQALLGEVDRATVISTDVFDTLLLRKPKSERFRILKCERLFSEVLAELGWRIDADHLAETRLQAQRLAFKELATRSTSGEVRLLDIIGRQLALIGVPQSLLDRRLQIELDVEKQSLFPNRDLGTALRQCKRRGMRIVAVSDSILPSQAVADLICHFHGPTLVDRVYSSADHGLTKRDGALFFAVAEAESIGFDQLVHIGDDVHADLAIPSAKGIAARHVPRHRSHRYARLANSAVYHAQRFFRRKMREVGDSPAFCPDTPYAFGVHVLGPIVTQFCLLLWLYAAAAEASGSTALLFCARGGIGIREAFERLIAKLSLPLRSRRENLMISRLIAARAALLVRSGAVVEELNREFNAATITDVAHVLGGRAYKLDRTWDRPFDGDRLLALLFSESGGEVLADIRRQHSLFEQHFRGLTRGADRIVLCDTGLYGSTQRLLANGFPELSLETIQFARANYKGHGQDHFARVLGLLVEQNRYSPLNLHSCVLRYWHLIESLFEPDVPTAKVLTENERGEVLANCGEVSFGSIDPSRNNDLLAGALAYIDALPAHGGAVAVRDAEIAWRRLNRAIAWPRMGDLKCLALRDRSVDFGRTHVIRVFGAQQNVTYIEKLLAIRSQLWREGAIAREFPLLKHALLPMLHSILSVRGLVVRQH